MFTLEDCVDYVNQIYLATHHKPLSDLKRAVLEGAWQGDSYQAIADRTSYSKDYINRDVAYELWNELSQSLGIKVSKSSFKSTLYDRWKQNYPASAILELGVEPFQRTFHYLSRPALEAYCVSTLSNPGALLRIKAPQRMGKTSLLEYCLHQTRTQAIQTVTINVSMAEQAIIRDLKSFLQWVCLTTTEELMLPDQLETHWNDRMGVNMNFVRYFERYILQTIDSPMILAFDNFDVLFSEVETFQEFSKILRSLYEYSKRSDRIGQVFQRLRLVVVHSTQAYPDIDVNHSPFNVGTTLELPPLTHEQGLTLIQSTASINWSHDAIAQLTRYLGGQPDLVQTAIAWIRTETLSLSEFLTRSITEKSPYRTDLHRMWEVLKHNPSLLLAFKAILTGKDDLPLASNLQFQLLSMGLVTLEHNTYRVSCGLYQDYFAKQLDTVA